MNGSAATNLVMTTSSTSFTRLITFGKRQHSFPYNMFYVSPQGLHPNVIFPYNSQIMTFIGPKFIYFSNQFFLRIRRQYFISLKKIIPTMYNMPQLDFIWPLFFKDWWLKILIWFTFFFNHDSCQSCLNEQCKGILSIHISRPF